MTPLSFSRGQMIREASLTEADLAEVAKCRRDHNRLGFAYQIGFVRLFNRFPAQQPLEICDELLSFVATQLNIDATGIDGYAARQHTVSDHQNTHSRLPQAGRLRHLNRLKPWNASSSRNRAAWSRRPRFWPGPASSSRSGTSCSPPSRRCYVWSLSRRSGPANTSFPSWPMALRPAW